MVFKKEKGFSLVEMAVVLTIVGVLIAGILSVGEMISNAETTQTISNLENFKSATFAFRTKYKSLPGDMFDANTKIDDCTGANNCTNGNGDGIIGFNNSFRDAMSGTPTQANNRRERWLFWKHLSLAGMIEDIDPADNGTEAGLPFLPIGALATVGSSGGSNSHCGFGDDDFAAGIWVTGVLFLNRNCTSDQALPVNPIKKIDLKIDDGKPNEGNLRAGASGANCTATLGSTDIYNVDDDDASCSLAYRIRK